jgi:glycosyltransferase involved in cell wall biosynthesis
MNILLMVNELRYTCGVTNHVIHLSRGLAETGKVNLWIACGGGNGINRFNDLAVNIITDKKYLHNKRNIATYASAINILTKFILMNKIDIIHSHTHYAANIAKKASGFADVRLVQTNHGILQDKSRLKHFNAEKYIAINDHIYNYLITNKISVTENIEFIRCGIPVDPLPPVKAYTKIKVIAASRFTKEKGIDIFIKAVSMLSSETRSKAEFYIAGEGEEEPELIKLNDQTNAEIKFLGNRKDIYTRLRDTHILVYPSRSKSEGFPAIITEAGATNNLVISSGFTGAADVISDNEDGIIFTQDSADDLTAKQQLIIYRP